VCEQHAQGCYLAAQRPGVEPATSRSLVGHAAYQAALYCWRFHVVPRCSDRQTDKNTHTRSEHIISTEVATYLADSGSCGKTGYVGPGLLVGLTSFHYIPRHRPSSVCGRRRPLHGHRIVSYSDQTHARRRTRNSWRQSTPAFSLKAVYMCNCCNRQSSQRR